MSLRLLCGAGGIFTIPNRFGIGPAQPPLSLVAASVINIYTLADDSRNVAILPDLYRGLNSS